MFRPCYVSLLVFLAPALELLSADESSGRHEVRTWTSSDGEHTTLAAFAAFKAGKVRLQKSDGKSVDVPLVDLSEEDQVYVREVAEDDPEAVQALEEAKAELEHDEDGRHVIQVQFPARTRVGSVEMLHLSSLPNLERLLLAQVRFSEGTFDEITHLSGLKTLDLTSTYVGNTDVRQLASLKNLEVLSLADTRITNRALSYVKELPKLRELSLANARLGDDGIAHLEEMKQLKRLILSNVRVSPQGARRLLKALPNTNIEGSGVVR